MSTFFSNPICLSCDICCRFTQQNSHFRPFFRKADKQIIEQHFPKALKELFYSYTHAPGEKLITPSHPKDHDVHICPFFTVENNHCEIYAHRPLDCILYPFMIMYNKEGSQILLTVDPQCKKVQETPDFITQSKHTIDHIISVFEEQADTYKDIHNLIAEYNPDLIVIKPLANLSHHIIHNDLGLTKVTASTQSLFEKYCNNIASSFTHNFSYLYLWSDFFNYLYKEIDSTFCLFATHDNTSYMPLPPQGSHISEIVYQECRKIIKTLNNSSILRIENILHHEKEGLGNKSFEIKESGNEYYYHQHLIAQYPGGVYKKKREYAHHFEHTHAPKIQPFRPEHTLECLSLYMQWADEKLTSPSIDEYQTYLLQDSILFHKQIMAQYENFPLKGLVLIVDNAIVGYTFGIPLNESTFCILAEITAHSYKGNSEFIFQQFAQQLSNYKYINTMDDSNIATLKNTKLSYHPSHITQLFQAQIKKLKC